MSIDIGGGLGGRVGSRVGVFGGPGDGFLNLMSSGGLPLLSLPLKTHPGRPKPPPGPQQPPPVILPMSKIMTLPQLFRLLE